MTERCYPEMLANTELKTLRWSLIKSIEPARVVHIRTQDLLNKDNIFAQVHQITQEYPAHLILKTRSKQHRLHINASV